MKKSQNKIFVIRNSNLIDDDYQFSIKDQIERLSLMIKRQKINSNYYQQPKKTEEKENLMELNDTNLNIIQYILNKKNRTQNELLIIKEFLSSLNLFNNHIQNINKDKLLLSLSSFLKMENMPKNSILFKFGNKGNKFYIVIKGELSVLILRETKVELNSVDYFIYLLLLRLSKEDELLKKTLLANNKIGLRMDEINFEYNYEKLVKFFNKYFKVNYKRNKDIKHLYTQDEIDLIKNKEENFIIQL